MLLDMDFQSDSSPAEPTPDSSQPRVTPVRFDDMMGSLPQTRPAPRPLERQPNPSTTPPVRDVLGSLPTTRPAGPVEHQPTTIPMGPIQMQIPPKKKNQLLRPLIGVLILIVVVIVTGYLTYSWQHGKISSLDNQITLFNKTVSNQTQQITLFQETVPNLVPGASAYTGWTNYSLKFEKLAFQYPKIWKLADTSANGSDNVSITSPNNFVITINTGTAATTLSANSLKLIGFTPVNFVGKFGYFDFVSTANDGLVEEALLSQSPINVVQPFASKASGKHPGTPGTFTLIAGYSGTGSNTAESQTLANASKDASYQVAQLLIDSKAY